MLFKSCVGFELSNSLNVKKYIWNMKYTIQHIIKLSQTTRSIQHNIDDTKSCDLSKCTLYNTMLFFS